MNPHYTVILHDFGDECVEASWGFAGIGAKKTARGQSQERERNIERCERRARAEVRRKCMAAGLDHILTLTYRENVEEKEKAYHDFELFIRHVHQHIPDWKYVAVPERQGRGAIHFHVGIKGYQDTNLLRSLWRGIVKDGNIDVSYRKTANGAQWKKAKLALYLAKYIGKKEKGKQQKVETDLNERRFRASPGITIPATAYTLKCGINAAGFALQIVKELGGRLGFVWSPEGSKGHYGWACSWG
jgi:hypothetical protein